MLNIILLIIQPTNQIPLDIYKTFLFESYRNKFLKPSSSEILKNPASRSAKLRYAVRKKIDFFYPEELKEKFKTYLDLENAEA